MLEVENALLRERIEELKEQQAELGSRMKNWLDTWEVELWESTAYAPLDSRAVEGMCYSGDPRITASGVEVVPGVTAAAGPGVPFGTRVYIPGFGFRVVQDRGGQIGPGQIDVAVGTQDEALAWGRRAVKVVYEKWRFNKAFAGTAAIRLNAIGF
jgi:3D (Asp-Asp-Asp) domain-containing protein